MAAWLSIACTRSILLQDNECECDCESIIVQNFPPVSGNQSQPGENNYKPTMDIAVCLIDSCQDHHLTQDKTPIHIIIMFPPTSFSSWCWSLITPRCPHPAFAVRSQVTTNQLFCNLQYKWCCVWKPLANICSPAICKGYCFPFVIIWTSEGLSSGESIIGSRQSVDNYLAITPPQTVNFTALSLFSGYLNGLKIYNDDEA